MAVALLCSFCRTIPFDSVFVAPHNDLRLLTLRDLWSQDRGACAFCRLLKHTLSTYYGAEYMESQATSNPGLQLRASQSPVDPRCDWIAAKKGKTTSTFHLELYGTGGDLERVEKKTGDEFSGAEFLPRIQALRLGDGGDGSSGSVHVASGKVTLAEEIDWDYIRGWLKDCDNKHSIAAAREISPHLNILAIDVEELRVVPMPSGPVRYIALSYMWGKDQRVKLLKKNYKVLTTKGALGKDGLALSRTVGDSIKVSQLLGCRYLWIDALCIIQDDAQSIQANLSAMDKIYAEAWLTVVAAAGNDADGGLPGLHRSLPRAESQLRVSIPLENGKQAISLANMLDTAKAALNFSTWNTRGWTYQERVLSRRLLSFTHSQVYFHCDRGCDCREDMYPLGDKTVNPTSDYSGEEEEEDEQWSDSFKSGYELSFKYDDLFTIYALAVARYSVRFLTNPSDKINAFAGLLARLSEPFMGPFVHGLPATLFDVGLLWEPVGVCTRGGREFPSWSWSGWDGAVRYGLKDSMANLCECTSSVATIEIANGVCLCAPPHTCHHTHLGGAEDSRSQWTRHFDEELLEVHYTTNDTRSRWYKYPRPLTPLRDGTGNPLSVPGNFPSRILHVKGLVVTLRISDQHSFAPQTLSTCRRGEHTQCHMALLDAKDRIVGHVLLDSRLISGLVRKEHRFLAISRSTLFRIDEDPSWDPETKLFRPWTHPESGCPALGEDEGQSSEDEQSGPGPGISFRRRQCFDEREFNSRAFWPVLNVLLLSEPREDGVVERVGIGKVHADGVLPVAREEEVLLG